MPIDGEGVPRVLPPPERVTAHTAGLPVPHARHGAPEPRRPSVGRSGRAGGQEASPTRTAGAGGAPAG